jgi:hypothetical protein
MKPQRCIVPLSDHTSGVEQGDCWRACIASIIELPPNDVPNFVDIADDDFLQATRQWLVPRGWAIFARNYGAENWPFDKLVSWLDEAGPGVAFIVTDRSGEMEHAVVALGGKVHDPSGSGICGPHICTEAGCGCGGYWCVYVIAPHHGGSA